MEEYAKKIEALRVSFLFDEDAPVLGPMSEQHFLLALAALDQAQRFMTLANYHKMRKD